MKEEKYKVRLPLGDSKLVNDVLYKEVTSSYEEKTKAVVLPSEYILKALNLAHSSPTARHGGFRVTLNRAQKLAFWPGMKRDVEKYCKKGPVYCRFKSIGNAYPAPLRHYPDVSALLEHIHMDLVGPVETSDNSKMYILTIRGIYAIPHNCINKEQRSNRSGKSVL